MLPESVRSLAFIGRHPVHLRSATLAIIPAEARRDLYARGLLECEDDKQIRCRLTPEGERIADELAEKAEFQGRAETSLSRRILEAEDELGLGQKLSF